MKPKLSPCAVAKRIYLKGCAELSSIELTEAALAGILHHGMYHSTRYVFSDTSAPGTIIQTEAGNIFRRRTDDHWEHIHVTP